jgi:AhpD family alkylhydroperoxidase
MKMRMDYRKVSPEGYRAFGAVHQYIAKCGLEESLIHLVYLRISQINGCAYCVDLHFRDALKCGVEARKINAVSAWVEMPFFSPRERAAFAWAESLTNVAKTGAPDEAYDGLKAHFSEKEIADLTYTIALMNSFNRLGVGFRMMPHVEQAKAAE